MRNSMKNYEGYFTGGKIKQINVNNYSNNHVYKYFKTLAILFFGPQVILKKLYPPYVSFLV